IDAINRLSPDDLQAQGVIKLVEGKTHEYICPNCGNGSGKDGTGIKPHVTDSHVGWHCHKCGETFNNTEIFARHYGLDKKANFRELCEKICADFKIPVEYDTQAGTKTTRKGAVPPAELNAINADLHTDIQPLKAFVAAQGGLWRGLPIEILERFGCRYIAAWTPPKARAAQKYATPSPRMIIPANADGLHSNYLARLTVPKNSFDESAQKYISEKVHSGVKTLFNPDALSADVVFCAEGYVDALSIEFSGFKAVAVGGADGYQLLVDAVDALEKKPRIIILFDGDDAGRKFAPKLQSALKKIGCAAVISFLSTAADSKLDANQILQEQDADYLMQELFALWQENTAAFEKMEKEMATAPEEISADFDRQIYQGDGSDLRNGERIAEYGKDKIRWLVDDEKWLLYDNGIWLRRSEQNSCVMPTVAQMARVLKANAQNNHEKGVAYLFTKQKKVNPAIFFLKGCKEILATASDLNHNKNLLACKNGVIDLESGKVFNLSPSFLITNQINAEYLPDADTAFVENFFAQVLPDVDTRRAVLRFLGYCLSGVKPYHIAEFWRGTGANGKSTILDILLMLFGTYAVKLPNTALLESRRPVDGNSATPAIAQLDGDIRLAIIDELPRNSRLDGALFKTITGDASTYARALYCNPRTIELRAKLILNGNHLPHFDVDDGGLQRRINTVEYTEKFEGDRADPDLPKKLALPENRSALLKILVDEAQEFYRSGLLESDNMKTAKAAYFAESDFVAEFIEEHCVIGDGGEVLRKTFEEKISATYPRECSRLKKKELFNLITAKLESLGASYAKAHGNKNVFKNVKL
ncbi:MAG: toprim domain-containing protein, partial [Selenomonadaceae bacterium]|nr:toprim domain-containing protein [Selenomonadaceae bacterium]